MRRIWVQSFDPHPSGVHAVVSCWRIGGGEAVLVAVTKASGDAVTWCDINVIEDPRGVLFHGTSSLLWSQTVFSAGVVVGELGIPDKRIVKPQDARQTLANLAGCDKAPRKDREVKELLQVLYGAGCFLREKACRKAKNKSHSDDCPLCDGLGWEREDGNLALLNTAHYRDAFLVALHVMTHGLYE